MKKVSKPFYFGSYLVATLLSAIVGIGAWIAGEGEIQEEHLPFVVLSSVLGLYAFVVFAILVYKMWKAIPPDIARTTPGKAVGFLFIPLFNLYWWFQALWGWAQDWNSYAAKSDGKLPPVSEPLPLAIAIFGVLGGTIGTIAGFAGNPWVGMVLAGPNYVLIPVFIFLVCNRLNAAPELPAVAEQGDSASERQSGSNTRGLISLILGILSIFVPYLGLIIGIVAIVLARKQRKLFPEPLSLVGLITGIIGTVLWSLPIAVLLLVGLLVAVDAI